ncbi:hypothetical protein [Flammeovirga kamogawensis]|uniref:Uncharacterized protein n=1 Tax=Flammeovirga kamogawensis TaxID=373891 RepID=A0ABX8H3V3_9BACT|nr:hypothetical protein [Flammeovirga kamogawensis]MBB6463606.1 hypothetical protein [Flammeovirga kamogawensis]QWG09830.1 hypothetical protein KM029_19310 [Flammeovirga kamogawensis]TRX65338.1 hypothetical protein EO216_22710 [Flammeovirga kamogawensis]
MTNFSETYLNIIELIVPEGGMKEDLKNDIKSFFKNPQIAFNDSNEYIGVLCYRPEVTPKTSNLHEFYFFDILTESFLQLINGEVNKDELWRKMSVLLIVNDLNEFRSKLDYEIYENETKNYSWSNTNEIINSPNYKVYGLTVENDMAVGIINSKYFDKFQELISQTDIKLTVLSNI